MKIAAFITFGVFLLVSVIATLIGSLIQWVLLLILPKFLADFIILVLCILFLAPVLVRVDKWIKEELLTKLKRS